MASTQQCKDSSEAVTVSAPGKVLLAGGYLVLESPNVGVVLATNKRFYTTIRREASGDSRCSTSGAKIQVKSPQFHCQWVYIYETQQPAEPDQQQSTISYSSSLVPSIKNPSINPFVEKTLRVVLMYLQLPQKDVDGLHVTIRADNDFYSLLPHLSGERSLEAVEALPRFLNCPVDSAGKAIVNKTGLGSSAALVTSLVGALMHFFRPPAPEESYVVHNLAQVCHCHAQGKVGSGFDVSAAIHGCHVYRRFPKCLLGDMLQSLEHFSGLLEEDAVSASTRLLPPLVQLAELDEWDDDMVTPIQFPQGQLQLILADVCGGSESPSMAKTILHWKSTHGGQMGGSSIPHWDTLKDLNGQVVTILESLPSKDVDYDALALLPAHEWPEEAPLKALYHVFQNIRKQMKSLGDMTGVPVEPDSQTQLCDMTQQLPGVVTAIVPGAGGFDAVACLYIDRPQVRQAIGDAWSQLETPVICPLGVQVATTGLQVETDAPEFHTTT